MNTTTITLGRYRVVVGIRQDNPMFASYSVFCGARFIGKQFSMPNESDCSWLEHNRGYADKSAQPGNRDYALRGGAATKRLWRVLLDEVPE